MRSHRNNKRHVSEHKIVTTSAIFDRIKNHHKKLKDFHQENFENKPYIQNENFNSTTKICDKNYCNSVTDQITHKKLRKHKINYAYSQISQPKNLKTQRNNKLLQK